MVLHILLAFSKFDNIQILVEVILIIWFVNGLFKVKFQFQEIILIVVYLIAIGVSFLTNELHVALLGGKVMGLGILSILYFSKCKLDTRFLDIVFIINIFLIIYWYITGINITQSMADQTGGSWANLSGRPLGLFMSAHASAYFAAIYLIYYLHRSRFFGLGLFLIYTTTSLFTLIAYLSQILITFMSRYIVLFFYTVLLCIGVFVVMLIFVSENSIENMLEILLSPISGIFAPDRIMGIGVIVFQMFNLEALSYVLTIFPNDYRSLLTTWVDDFGNELMLFTYMQHAGLLLFVCYLWVLRSKSRYFFIFSLVGLFHYGDITTPLIVCMLVTYSTLIQNQEKNSD